MENKRRALGKGLEQLFNSENLDFDQIETEIVESAEKDEVVNVPLSELRPNPYQPRKVFDKGSLNELADSIRQNGIIQPIIVKKSIKGFEIVAGERRVKASRQIGLKSIPAIIRDFTDNEMMQIALLENLQRENLSAIEEAEAYKSIIESLEITQEQLGKQLGKSRSHITNVLGLLRLPNSVQELVLHNKLSMGHARVLSKLDDVDRIENLAQQVIKKDLSVRELEKLTSKTDDQAKPKPKKPKTSYKQYNYIENNLKELLGTKVLITKNKVQINFNSPKDLDRILRILNVKIDE